VILASYAPSLVNFRLDLIRDLIAAGHEVIAAAPGDDTDVDETLRGIGARYEPIVMDRAGVNPLSDVRSLSSLVGLFRRIKPDLVFAYTIKPVIYGLLAARLAGVQRRFGMITGLSYALMGGDGMKRRLLKALTVGLYRRALVGADAVIFQNASDLAVFTGHEMTQPGQKTVVVDGSGVNLETFSAAPLPEGPPTFLLMARLLADKGIREFADAARRLKKDHPEWRFQILGPLDVTPTAINKSEVEAWQEQGVIDYLGATKDVRPYLRACSAFVLPSYYPEGLPRSILEAMAIGRAIITTDRPGCRETVIAGENGYLVPAGEVEPLADAMAQLAEEPGRLRAYGEASRSLAERRFDVRLINKTILRILGADGGQTLPKAPAASENTFNLKTKKPHEASL
jgi:glycosyltransferase involved in cell wall biosynthesis